MDIYQMGGGDSLYDKIDRGVRGCNVVVSCVTPKYALSANCRREISLTDALKKPLVPLMLEEVKWPPSGPMSMVFTELLYINMYKDETIQTTWKGDKFDELIGKLQLHVPEVHPTKGEDPKYSGVEKKGVKPTPMAGRPKPQSQSNPSSSAVNSGNSSAAKTDQQTRSQIPVRNQGQAVKEPSVKSMTKQDKQSPSANSRTSSNQSNSKSVSPSPKPSSPKKHNSNTTPKSDEAPKSPEKNDAKGKEDKKSSTCTVL